MVRVLLGLVIASMAVGLEADCDRQPCDGSLRYVPIRTLGAVAAPVAAPSSIVQPPAPIPVSPRDLDTVKDVAPVLSVESRPEAELYQFRVMEGGSIAAQGYSLTADWCVAASGHLLQRGHAYLWSCRVWERGEWSPWFAPAWRFDVGFNLPSPQLKMPQDGATVVVARPVFVVKPVLGAVGYRFRVWDGKTLMAEGRSDLPVWRYDGKPLETGAGYQWSCRAENPEDTSDFAPAWSFEVSRVPCEDGASGDASREEFSVAAWPNPFRSVTAISLRLAADGPAEVTIHDASGRLVRVLTVGGERTAVSVLWDGTDLSGSPVTAGTYFCRVSAGGTERAFRLVRIASN